MKYVALLRDINVGDKSKIVMNELRKSAACAGFTNVRNYISSGNLLLESDVPTEDMAQVVENILGGNYNFSACLAILTGGDYLAELSGLPDWQHGDIARRDTLFYTRGLDRDYVREHIKAMELSDEAVRFGKSAVLWGKFDEKEFLEVAYHKHLLREGFHRQMTIRSSATVEKIIAILPQC